jgi:hypothetical protein
MAGGSHFPQARHRSAQSAVFPRRTRCRSWRTGDSHEGSLSARVDSASYQANDLALCFAAPDLRTGRREHRQRVKERMVILSRKSPPPLESYNSTLGCLLARHMAKDPSRGKKGSCIGNRGSTSTKALDSGIYFCLHCKIDLSAHCTQQRLARQRMQGQRAGCRKSGMDGCCCTNTALGCQRVRSPDRRFAGPVPIGHVVKAQARHPASRESRPSDIHLAQSTVLKQCIALSHRPGSCECISSDKAIAVTGRVERVLGLLVTSRAPTWPITDSVTAGQHPCRADAVLWTLQKPSTTAALS